MVASWVSQASFEPLGLTIAVAKDRAIESMMQVRRVAAYRFEIHYTIPAGLLDDLSTHGQAPRLADY